jgi:hypothetical protein
MLTLSECGQKQTPSTPQVAVEQTSLPPALKRKKEVTWHLPVVRQEKSKPITYSWLLNYVKSIDLLHNSCKLKDRKKTAIKLAAERLLELDKGTAIVFDKKNL